MRDMTALAPYEVDMDPRHAPVDVEIVVPVYNEAAQLAERITALRTFLDESFPFRALVTIVDNASTDDTVAVATALVDTLPGVAAMHLDRKGRGCALREAWSTSNAPVVAYMDVDLSTSLDALLPARGPVALGPTRRRPSVRGLAAAPTSCAGPSASSSRAAYNLILKLTLRGRFSDAQCGFKALRRDAAERLLPLVEDNKWFFDTELLVIAERLGLRIGEVPVDWVDDPDSRVNIVSTATDDLRGVWRMLCRPGPHRDLPSQSPSPSRSRPISCLRFAGVGLISTLGYLFLFVAWRPLFGAFGANAVAMAIATIFNTAVHKELSRGADGQTHHGRMALVTVLLYMVSLAFTSLGFVVAQWIAPGVLLAASSRPDGGQSWSPPPSASRCCGPGCSVPAAVPSTIGRLGGAVVDRVTPHPAVRPHRPSAHPTPTRRRSPVDGSRPAPRADRGARSTGAGPARFRSARTGFP